MFNYLLAGKKTEAGKMGVSLAASWAWGVSVVVGMEIFQGKGLAAFVIWAAGNSLALLLFGLLSLKVNIGLTLQDVSGSRFIHWFAFAIQFFSILANMTALKIAAVILGLSPLIFTICICVVVIAYTWRGGLKASIETDLLQFMTWMALLLAVILLGGCSSNSREIVLSGFADVRWATWGAVTLLAAPFVDQQLWQRRFALKVDSLRAFVAGAVCFAVYMILVGLAAYYNVGGIVIGLVILMVAMSTLDSAFMAVACYGRRSPAHGRFLALVVFAAALLFLLFDIGLLELWTFYSSLRLPVAAYVIYRIAIKK